LSFVAAGERAVAVHPQAGLRTAYWDWTKREGKVHYNKFCGTPPEHMLFGLRKAFDMLFEEGLENVIERHRLLAGAVHRAVAAWAEGGAIELNITEPAERSRSVTTLLFKDGLDPMPLRDYCQQKIGVVVGVGIGALGGKALRIAHMGHVNAPMILGTLGGFETGLIALGIPHGAGGLRAATEWLGRSVPA